MNDKITETDLEYFRKAKEIALLSDKRTKVGCIAVYNNRIISTGCNGSKTHPLQLEYNKYRDFDGGHTANEIKAEIHAEIGCLSRLIHYDIRWNKVKLYIYRVCRSREKGLSYPCNACMRLIKDLGIRHIYFTTDYGYAYQLITNK